MAVHQLALEALANKEGGEYWYIAPSYTQAKTIAWRMIKNVYYRLPQQVKGKINEAELSIEIYKSKISLKGVNNEDSLRGSGLWGMVLDEVASYKNFEYLWSEVLRPALSDYRGFTWFISTPKGFNHFYELFNKQEKDSDYVSFQFNSYENPYLPVEEIEKAKFELTEDAFAQEYLSDFRKYTGLVYKEFDRNIHVIDPIDLNHTWRFFRSLDFGASNPTVCLWIAVDNADNVYVFDEYYQSRAEIETHAGVIRAKTDRLGYEIEETYGDPSAEQEMIDYASKNIYISPAVKVITGNRGWVNSGIDAVANLLKVHEQTKRPRLFVFKNCFNVVREFESYRWKKTKTDINDPDQPEKTNDHCMDALRYFVVSYKYIGDDVDRPVPIEYNPVTGY